MFRISNPVPHLRRGVCALVAMLAFNAPALAGSGPDHSVARQWNEELLYSIRHDFARPTVHARNLYHVSAAMWDAWAAYDGVADQVLHHEAQTAKDIDAARRQTISFAAFRILRHRFENSPGGQKSLARYDALMDALGFDRTNESTKGNTPAALGNRIAATYIAFGLNDGSNEANGYANQFYEPVNPPLLPDFPGNPDMIFPNRWQPLALEFFIDQSGNPIPTGYPDFLSPEWGQVEAFALKESDRVIYHRDGFDYWVYHDPGPPPLYGDPKTQWYYKWGAELVSIWSGHLDPNDGVMWDISPASIGNVVIPEKGNDHALYDLINGGDWGTGHALNPVTSKPYAPQIVPRGDYARVLAEFWADGPASETPPGHWFTILNYVSDHPLFDHRWQGEGEPLDPLEWDVKAYLTLGGAMHDVAVAVWGIKGWYDYSRPISAIRYLADRGQCTDPLQPSFNPLGIDLVPGWIEVVTAESTKPGERHEHLAGVDDKNLGKIAVLAWRGHEFIVDPKTDSAGVGWILAENWWPYQRPSFVTPPFAGYVSGHSTFSRAAAEVMTLLTGDAYFPGGMGEFECPKNEFLVFEQGPSVNLTLQWAKYRDASDQCSLSRIWGSIHPPADDVPGRRIGLVIGPDAFSHALRHYEGRISCPADLDQDREIGFDDFTALLAAWSSECNYCPADIDDDGDVDFDDFVALLASWGDCE